MAPPGRRERRARGEIEPMRGEISIPTEKGGPEIVKEGGRFETRNTYVKKRKGAKGYGRRGGNGEEVNSYKK